jgi:hypothetical protein
MKLGRPHPKMNRIIGTNGQKQTGGSRELNNQKVHNLHPPPNIIRMIKSRRIMIICLWSQKMPIKFSPTTCGEDISDTA